MNITANGKPYELAPKTTLTTFLESQGQTPGLVVVERNQIALSPSESNTVILEEGDQLEIVKIVAGG